MKIKIVISTYVFMESFSRALRDYLLREKEMLFVGNPLFGNPLPWSIDAIDTFWQVVKRRRKHDVYFVMNYLNIL